MKIDLIKRTIIMGNDALRDSHREVIGEYRSDNARCTVLRTLDACCRLVWGLAELMIRRINLPIVLTCSAVDGRRDSAPRPGMPRDAGLPPRGPGAPPRLDDCGEILGGIRAKWEAEGGDEER